MGNFVERIAQKICPKCKAKKLVAGPFYDRGKIACYSCGVKFRVKPK